MNCRPLETDAKSSKVSAVHWAKVNLTEFLLRNYKELFIEAMENPFFNFIEEATTPTNANDQRTALLRFSGVILTQIFKSHEATYFSLEADLLKAMKAVGELK